MKILIIGSKGMLGQELARSFAAHDLNLWDREEIDITDAAQVLEKIKSLAPEIIINSAAYNAVDEAEKNPEIAFRVNADGPRNLAAAARDIHAKIIHFSTGYVFDGASDHGYNEESVPNPISQYGESKLAGERAVIDTAPEYYLIRLSRLFGQPAISENAKKSFVDVMRSLAETKNELNLVNEEFDNPTYAPDLADQVRYIVENNLARGIYHITNAGTCHWYDFAAEIFKILGKEIKLNAIPASTYPRPARRPANSALVNTKLPPLRSWQEALREYLLGK